MPGRRKTDIDPNIIAIEFKYGHRSVKYLAMKYECSEKTIRNRLKEAGVKLSLKKLNRES